MKTIRWGRFLLLIAMLLIVGSATVALAQYSPGVVRPRTPRTAPDPVPNPLSIKGQIKWKKDLGIPQYHVNPGDSTCSRFELYVYEPTRHDRLLRGWVIDNEMHDDGEYYYCTYEVTSPLVEGHHYRVEAGFRDSQDPFPKTSDSSLWRGGAPPRGNDTRIVFNPSRDITLGPDNQADTEDFEVLFKSAVYTPRPPRVFGKD